MKNMDLIKDMLCEEIDEAGEKMIAKGKIAATDIDSLHKLTDTYKNLAKIEMIEQNGYSEDGYPRNSMRMHDYDRGSSYADRYRKRDSMGRYSRADATEEVMRHMGEAMNIVDSEREREIIRKAMNQLDR